VTPVVKRSGRQIERQLEWATRISLGPDGNIFNVVVIVNVDVNVNGC
jgi:hypothetical protein